MQELLATIANPATAPSTLTQAIRALGTPAEPTAFWTAIASSDRYTADHRRLALVALFERHLRPPITLAELARMLDGATWLKDDDVEIVQTLGGLVPVTVDFQNPVFVVRLLPDTSGDHPAPWAVYLRVEGPLELAAFRRALRGDGDAELLNRRILDMGLTVPHGR